MSGENKSEKPIVKIYPYHVSTLYGKKSLCISKDYWKNNAVYINLSASLVKRETIQVTVNIEVYHLEQKFKEAQGDIYVSIAETLKYIDTKYKNSKLFSHPSRMPCNTKLKLDPQKQENNSPSIIFKYSDIIHIPITDNDPKNIYRFDRAANADKKYLPVIHNGKPVGTNGITLPLSRKCCNFEANVALEFSLHSLNSEEWNEQIAPLMKKKP